MPPPPGFLPINFPVALTLEPTSIFSTSVSALLIPGPRTLLDSMSNSRPTLIFKVYWEVAFQDAFLDYLNDIFHLEYHFFHSIFKTGCLVASFMNMLITYPYEMLDFIQRKVYFILHYGLNN